MALVARVALNHGANANQAFQWRRLYRNGMLGGTSADRVSLLPVSVLRTTGRRDRKQQKCVVRVPARFTPTYRGEIRISLEGSVDQALVRTVLKSLRGSIRCTHPSHYKGRFSASRVSQTSTVNSALYGASYL